MRKIVIINILVVVIIIALLPILYLLGNVFGLVIALVNVGIIVGLMYWYLFMDNLKRISAVIIGCMVSIIILYFITGSYWGPIVLVGIDGFALLVVVADRIARDKSLTKSISDGITGTLREIKYSNPNRSSYFSRNIRYQKRCIICGRPLRTRRKYCSVCRPFGSSVPREDNEPTFKREYPTYSTSRPTKEIVRSSREREYIGNKYSNLSMEDYVGKRKKKRFF